MGRQKTNKDFQKFRRPLFEQKDDFVYEDDDEAFYVNNPEFEREPVKKMIPRRNFPENRQKDNLIERRNFQREIYEDDY